MYSNCFESLNWNISATRFRSLVALSLVLSLLLFKPAPLYILDEVDAALDLSHTQNIGQMLRTHFTHSQVQTTCYMTKMCSSQDCCSVSVALLVFRQGIEARSSVLKVWRFGLS